MRRLRRGRGEESHEGVGQEEEDSKEAAKEKEVGVTARKKLRKSKRGAATGRSGHWKENSNDETA